MDLYPGLSLVSFKSIAKPSWTSAVMGLHPQLIVSRRLSFVKYAQCRSNCFAVKVAVSTLPHYTFLTLVIVHKYIFLSSASPAPLQ